jgi:transglutaminase-like putative cysteine protease
MEQYLQPTPILDYNSKDIKELVEKHFSFIKNPEKKLEKIYYFVRDEIKFGFNESDNIPASRILKDGYGQCNTKTSLFMALVRTVEIPSRAHFFKINKRVQKGVFPSHIYNRHLKEEIIHSWPEVYLKDKWIALEGVILDKDYLRQIKNRFDTENQLEGYGVSVKDLSNLSTDWTGDDTYIQKESITKDEGIYASPDEYYEKYGANVSGLEKVFFKYVIRHLLNRKLRNTRNGKW